MRTPRKTRFALTAQTPRPVHFFAPPPTPAPSLAPLCRPTCSPSVQFIRDFPLGKAGNKKFIRNLSGIPPQHGPRIKKMQIPNASFGELQVNSSVAFHPHSINVSADSDQESISLGSCRSLRIGILQDAFTGAVAQSLACTQFSDSQCAEHSSPDTYPCALDESMFPTYDVDPRYFRKNFFLPDANGDPTVPTLS